MAVLIGIVIGLVLGLTGAGGSVLAVPLLALCLKLPMNHAAGIALGAVAASAISGVIQRIHSKQVLWVPAAILATTGAAVAPVGRWVAQGIPEAALLIGFVLLASAIAVRMWRQAVHQPDTARVIRAGAEQQAEVGALLCPFSATGHFQLQPRCIAGLCVGGAVVGFLSGMFGVGGGFLIVPLLMMLSIVPYAIAVATSLAVIAVVSSAGFISYLLMSQEILSNTLLQVAGGGVLGMFAGFLIGQRGAGATLQKIFSVSVVLLSAALLLKLI
ncbi:MAG: sulfite exporter TauE/SafE family protein [Pseudomonadales bacterium]|nr:sulfite exporter TauE/SafE family protein [Pseudomonadales bacterium]